MVRRINYKNVVGNFISPKIYDVASDGVTDDTTALQNYFNYCVTEGVKARLHSGVYKINSPITLTGALPIEFDDDVIIDCTSMPDGVSLNQRAAIILPSVIASSVAMTASLLEGGFQVTVSNTSTFAVGDYIVISSNQYYSDGVSSNTKLRGFVARVTSIVSGTVLAIDKDSPYNIDHTQTGIVRKLTMYKGMKVIGNASFLMGGLNSAHNGLILNNTLGAEVHGISVDGAEQSGINFAAYNINALVTNCFLKDSTSPAIGTTGYGITFGTASEGCIADANYIENCRHSIAGGGTLASNKCVVRNNRTVRCGIGTSDLDAHEDCFDWTFSGNWSTAGGDRLGGIVARGKRNTIINNYIEYASIGVRIENFIADTSGHNNHVISGNTIVGANTSIAFSNDYNNISKAVVSNNNLINAANYHIFAKNMYNLLIAGNLFETCTGTTGTLGHAIVLDGTNGKINVNDNIFKNINASTSRMCVASTSGAVTTELTLANNSFDNVRGICDVYGTSRISITGSTGEIGNGTTAGNIYSFRNCDNIFIANDVLKYNAATGSNDYITIFNTGNAYKTGLSIINNSVTGTYRRPLNIVPITTTLSGDGATTSFALAYTGITAAQLSVTIGGVAQDENTFTYSSPNIVFGTAPAAGTGNIVVTAALQDRVTIFGNNFLDASNATKYVLPPRISLFTSAFGNFQRTPVTLNASGSSPTVSIANADNSDFTVRLAGSTGTVTIGNPTSNNAAELTFRILNNDTVSRDVRFNTGYRRNATAVAQALFSGNGLDITTLVNATFAVGEERLVRFRQTTTGVWLAMSDSWSTKALTA